MKVIGLLLLALVVFLVGYVAGLHHSYDTYLNQLELWRKLTKV